MCELAKIEGQIKFFPTRYANARRLLKELETQAGVLADYETRDKLAQVNKAWDSIEGTNDGR